MRPSKVPGSRLGRFLYRQLKAHGITQSQLAKRLKVSSATITRLIQGETKRLKTVTIEDFCEAIGLSSEQTREFKVLAAEGDLVFAASTPATPRPLDSPTPLFRYRHLDLDVLDSALMGWSTALGHNHDPIDVLNRLIPINQTLKELQEQSLNPRVADLRISGGMLIAAVKEAVLPWRTQRPVESIRVYDDLEKLFFEDPRKLPKGFERHQARLMLRRAILYRERDEVERCLEELELIRSFDLDRVEDHTLQVALATQSLHTTTTFMEPTERIISEWQKSADKIRARIDAFPIVAAEKEHLQAVVDYTMGVGWKRFMWRLHTQTPSARTPTRMIEEYARNAVSWLDTLRKGPEGAHAVRNINMYHESISDSLAAPEMAASVIDALVWSNPEEALARAEQLRADAESRFPTVLAKLDESIRLANWRLGRIGRTTKDVTVLIARV